MRKMMIYACLMLMLFSCKQSPQTDHIRILATSDTHNMFYPYNYALNERHTSGSMPQVATAIKSLRDSCTLVFEVGDIVQDNSADLFLNDSLHPMMAAMNAIGYDAWVTGNHEYNYGMPSLRRFVSQCNAPLLVGNVFSPEGEMLGMEYKIFEIQGVKVCVIGMVTPNIVNWDKKNLEGWSVLNPVEQTAKVISRLRKKCDLMIAIEHMGLDSEYGVPGSGARELAMACPELDLIIAAHAHVAYADSVINGVPVVANKNWCATLAKIDFTYQHGAWKANPEILEMSGYEPDADVLALMEPYHQRALAFANEPIGYVFGWPLIRPSKDGIHEEFMHDAAWPDLIANAMLYYSDADVAASFIVPSSGTINPGPICRADVAVIYKYSNSLYKLRITGAQLKKYMEWATSFFLTWHPGEKTLRCNPDFRAYNCDFFTGVSYEINLSKEIGERIENLRWTSTDKPVLSTDTLTIAVSNYRAATHLLHPGVIFSEEDGIPELLETDMRSDIGTIRDMIARYITDVLGGEVRPVTDRNWRLVGIPSDISVSREATQR